MPRRSSPELLNDSGAIPNSAEAELEKLEKLEAKALLNGDTAMLLKLMSPQLIVQNPQNAIVDRNQIMERVKTGKIKFQSFKRVIEKISVIQNIGIVMGEEIIIPHENTSNAGKVVTSRFMNIWIRTGNSWKLTARQTTIISVD
jgi:hypothetical protein